MKRFKTVTVLVVFALSAPVPASPQEVLQLGESARSLGLGKTGTADDTDPGNLHFNPATMFSLQGVIVTGNYTEMRNGTMPVYSIGVLGGKRFGRGRPCKIGLAGGLEYVKWSFEREEGWIGTWDGEDCVSLSISGGLFYKERFRIALGFSAKPTTVHIGPLFTTPAELVYCDYGTWAYDLGFMIEADFLRGTGSLLSTSAGLGYLGLGDDITRPPHCPYGPRVRRPLPERLRFGFGIRYESPWRRGTGKRPGASAPVVSLSGNLDFTRDRRLDIPDAYGWGAEIGIIQILFMRIGYIDNESCNTGDFTYGMGLRLSRGRLWARFDYAKGPPTIHYSYRNDHTDKFGCSAGFTF